MHRVIGFVSLMSMLALPVFGIVFDVPIDCEYGSQCFIQNYVDIDPAEGRVGDHMCGKRTYDGHRGTDFRLIDYVEMRRGVAVLAAADGVVVSMRDGVPDSDKQAKKSGVPVCGNGVIIQHKDGWSTQYCHLKKASVIPRKGHFVRRGEKIGEVGLSGRTEFPHLHFSVRKDQHLVDPFIGDFPVVRCQGRKQPLWSRGSLHRLQYIPTALLNASFSNKEPRSGDLARKGRYRTQLFSSKAVAILVWVDLMGVEAGDVLNIRIFDPQERILFKGAKTFDRPFAQYFAYNGRKREELFWPKGRYRAQIELIRSGQVIITKSLEMKVK